MALLEVDNLKTYFHTRNGVVKAVDDISFTLEKGEILGIVGESGSGKSVTVHTLMGLVPQPPGRIEGGTAKFDERQLCYPPIRSLTVVPSVCRLWCAGCIDSSHVVGSS